MLECSSRCTMEWTFVICVACIFLQELAYAAITPCVKVDDCSCKLTDSDQQINIRSLGYSDQSEAPRFGYTRYDPAFLWEYAYNPCYPWSDTDASSACKNVVACQRSYKEHNVSFDIADVTATWKTTDQFYYIQYSHAQRTTVVMLNCDSNAKTPTLGLNEQLTNFYNFTLTSECCCPGTCNASPTPTSPPSTNGGISIGSAICIIASVLIIVYLIGGVLFMKFVQHAEGTDLIPNRDMWLGLLGYIKDGFVFIFTLCKKPGYTDTF